MYKQAIVRYLSPQQVADLLMAKLHGNGDEDQTGERRESVGTSKSGDDVVVWGRGEDGCQWVDDIITADNLTGVQLRKEAQAKAERERAEREAIQASEERSARLLESNSDDSDVGESESGKQDMGEDEFGERSETNPGRR